jgi:dTDP-4-amino-4,6-dideoxygalactose transaminase
MDGKTMKPLSPLVPFRTIGSEEKLNIIEALKEPLSWYLGGQTECGPWTWELAKEWRETFNCEHALPCNSGTSGLLAACIAAGVGTGDLVLVTSYSMSATAACAVILGADVLFGDIENSTLGLDPDLLDRFINTEWLLPPKAVIVTNLHGHPARLMAIRKWCDNHGSIMIEDNAQGFLAMDGMDYAGTIGHMGVFSLNVHKHIQAGEGGVIVTDSPQLFEGCNAAINHGELGATKTTGLNLRMTEPTAAIACAQLKKGTAIVNSRRYIALELNDAIKNIPWLHAPIERLGCISSYYMWCPRVANSHKDKRAAFVAVLNEFGFPVREGYVQPLHKLFNERYQQPVVEDVESRIISYENCAYDPNESQIQHMKDILQHAAEVVTK